MLYGDKRMENRVSKTTGNDQISHFAENAEKRAGCQFSHQPHAVHKCVKCNVHVNLKRFTAFLSDCLFKDINSCIILAFPIKCSDRQYYF